MDSKQTSNKANAAATGRVRVWDWPVRIFHWSLALLVGAALLTAELGGNWIVWHGRCGILIVGLLVFRLVWGMAGATYARFAQFFPTPARLGAYFRGQWHGVGHNPLGALSVLALLGLLVLQAGSGLFANNDIDFTGPLFNLVSQERSNWLSVWHHRIGDVLFWLVGLHVAEVFFYLWFKKKNLIKPMLTGWSEEGGAALVGVESAGVEPAVSGKPSVLVVALVLAMLAMWLASGTFV